MYRRGVLGAIASVLTFGSAGRAESAQQIGDSLGKPSNVDPETNVDGYDCHYALSDLTEKYAKTNYYQIGPTATVNDWVKHPDNPVLSPGNGWEAEDVLDPAVIKIGDTYHMIYRGDAGNSDYRFGHATSRDLISWAKDSNNPVLEPASGDRVNTPSLVFDGGVVHLFYHTLYNMYHAWSTDFVNWTKNPHNPVFGPSEGGFDKTGIPHSTVIYLGGTFYCLYTGYNRREGTARLGLAISEDLTNWSRYGSPVLEPSTDGFDDATIEYPELLRVGDAFHLIYNGRDDSGLDSVGYAQSRDLVNWRKCRQNPVLTPEGHGFDESDIRYTSVIYDGGVWKMIYTGENDSSNFQLGVATLDIRPPESVSDINGVFKPANQLAGRIFGINEATSITRNGRAVMQSREVSIPPGKARPVYENAERVLARLVIADDDDNLAQFIIDGPNRQVEEDKDIDSAWGTCPVQSAFNIYYSNRDLMIQNTGGGEHTFHLALAGRR